MAHEDCSAKERIIRTALDAYNKRQPCFEVEYPTKEQAASGESGMDTLRDFIIMEYDEAIYSDSLPDAKEEAWHLLNNAINDLTAARDAVAAIEA